MFRSPLSRMLLSPQLHQRERSPSSSRRGFAEIDFNVEICSDIDLNATPEEQLDLHAYDDGAAPPTQQHAYDDGAAPPTQQNSVRKEIPDVTRKAVFEFLLARSKNGELKRHETGEASAAFSVHIRTVQHIWKEGKRLLDQGDVIDVSSKKSKRGRKKEVDLSKLRALPISSRSTLEDVSKHLEVSKSKLHKMKKEGTIERVSNSLKPFLTDINKKERLKWCISMLDPRSVPHDPIFKGLFDFVFIDEKWFNITWKTERYYKATDEEQPTRACKNKQFIPKLMILCEHARPRYDSQANCTFDGKIGCFPFVTYEAAKRSSKNRRAGTIEIKPMDTIKSGVSREFLIQKVLPAILAKWPREDANKPIFIQQDNAPSHVTSDDALFCEAVKQDGFDIRLISQPPNSPDLNVLDLGFFSFIQSIQYKTNAKTTEDRIAAVQKAFEDYSPLKANRIFLTLHSCMKEIMKVHGGNNYNIPHIRKEMLRFCDE